VGEGVPELVRVHLADTRPLAAAPQQRGDAGLVQPAPALNPEPVGLGVGMAGSESQVPVEGLGGANAEGARTLPPSLAEHEGHLLVEVEVAHPHAEQLGAAHPGVGQQADDGLVTAILERLRVAGGEERPELVVAQHRHGLVGHMGRRHARHRTHLELILGHAPLEELLQGPEAVRGGRR
jgi:hypothetical protein